MQNGIFKKAWYLPGLSGKFTGMGVKGMWHYLISYYSVISLGLNLQIGEITCIIIKKKKKKKGRERREKENKGNKLPLSPTQKVGFAPGSQFVSCFWVYTLFHKASCVTLCKAMQFSKVWCPHL